jgi:hypothetical protein
MLTEYGVREPDSRIVLLDETRTARVICTDMLSYSSKRRLMDQGTFEIVAPNSSPIWTAQYDAVAASDTRWLNWSIDYWFRGAKEHSGPFAGGSIEESGEASFGTKPLAYARLTACTWMVWLLGGKTIQTTTGSSWTCTGHWDNIMRQLVRDNCTAACLTPTTYPAIARQNYGPFILTVEADSSSSTEEDTFVVQCDKPVLDTVMELATTPTSKDNWLWPYVEETGTPGTFIFKVKTGRTGGSRGIGSDKTGTVVFSSYRGTVQTGKSSFDHTKLTSVAGVGGTGRGAGKLRTFVHEPTLFSKIGAREEALTLPASTASTERAQEARRMLAESNEDTTRSYEYKITEAPGLVYRTNFADGDDVQLASAATGETISKMVIGADVGAASPDAADVSIVFGSLPRQPVRDAQRSGGGGKGGGRRSGGKPKDSDGNSVVDPDTINSYSRVGTNSGDVDAEGPNHYLTLKGYDTATYLRAYVEGTDVAGSGGAGTPDRVTFKLHGNADVTDLRTASHIVKLRNQGGGADIFLLALLDPNYHP